VAGSDVTDVDIPASVGLGDSSVEARTFAWSASAPDEPMRRFVAGLGHVLAAHGYTDRGAPGPDVQVVFHHLDPERPRAYRRRSAPTFVVALVSLPDPPGDLLAAGYPLLVRGLANLCLIVSARAGGPVAQFVTLEQGTYAVEHPGVAGDPGTDAAFYEQVFARLEPLAASRLVIANEWHTDLPRELWDGDEQTGQIRRAGEHLDALDLLPSAFPIEDILSERDLRHVKLLYGIGGLSYGNVSARRQPPAESAYGPEFWMSASGVDKGALHDVGRHILLVRGFDEARGCMVLSVPPDVTPNRVSVDAIEHWMIYREHPEVGAILHAHTWMDGVESTQINYPCGTVELAGAVADLVRRAPDPGRAVVGQRNHGLTITGASLDEIFARVDGKLVRTVPMD